MSLSKVGMARTVKGIGGNVTCASFKNTRRKGEVPSCGNERNSHLTPFACGNDTEAFHNY